jgi:hypothetical protein
LSNTVSSQTPQLARTLQREQKDFVEKKQRELQNLRNIFKKEKESIINNGNQRIIDQRMKNDEVVNNLKKSKSLDLKEFDKNYENKKNILEKNLKQIEKMNAIKLNDISDNLEHSRNIISDKHYRKVNDLNAKQQRNIQKTVFDDDNELYSIRERNQGKIIKSEENFQERYYRINDNFRNTLNKEKNKYDKILRNNQFSFQEDFYKLDKKNKNKIKDLEEKHKSNIKELKQNQITQMVELKTKFKKRYNDLGNKYNSHYTSLDKTGNTLINNLIKEKKIDKELIKEKGDDQFYAPNKLEPRISRDGENYIVEFNVPDHEKGQVILNVEDRKGKLTHSREVKLEYIDEHGEKNKTSKTESNVKYFSIPDIIDNRNIESFYNKDDQLLTFILPKK